MAFVDDKAYYPTPIVRIIRDLESGAYGFYMHFDKKPPHWEMLDCFESVDCALAWADPHKERIWEESEDEGVVMISRSFRPGTVSWRELQVHVSQIDRRGE